MSTIFNIENFEANKNYVIEASAGTGKTYNIIEIVKSLVNKFGLDLSEILIVTYTEKAAGELKDRVRKELVNQDVDNASIFTIHSFCQSAIKEFGISANLPLNLNIISDEELEKFIDRYLREGDILKDITSYSTIGNFNFDTMKELLRDTLNKYYLNNAFQEEPSIIKLEEISESEQKVFEIYTASKNAKNLDELISKFPEMAENYDVFKKSNEPKAQDFIIELQANYNNNLNFNGRTYKTNTAWSTNPNVKEELKKAFAYFNELKNLLKNINPYEYFIKLYLKDFYIKWQKEKELNKYQTFNDMIRYVRESILTENSSMKVQLRNKYKYAIIDEFQDTNQLQFDIFSNVFMCEGHNIIVVGDPKQSIYSFQGADIEVYYAAKEAIEASGGVICELAKNYRSSASMVRSCNELFKYFDFSGTTFTSCEYLTEEVDKKEHKVSYNNHPSDAFWFANDVELSPELFAKIAVETIVDCCLLDENKHTKLRIKDKGSSEYRNVSFKDFAVLARARSEMKIIEYALKQAGVPYIRYKDTSLFLGKECADWIAIFTALNADDLTGRNRKLFKKTLFTKFFGLNLKKISADKYDTDLTDEIKLLKKWRVLANERRWEDLVDDIVVESGIIERMKSLTEIQSLGIYKQIGNYCVEYLSNNHSIEELVINLEKMADGVSGDAENGPIVEKSTNFDCVQIMTMHASKGLQFPVVISFGAFKDPLPNKIFTYHLEKDGSDYHMLGFKENALTKSEAIEEYKRLIYVAYTRAQFVMLLPYYKSFAKNLDFIKDSMTKFFDDENAKYRILTASENGLEVLCNDVKKILERSANENQILESSTAKEDQDIILKKIISDISKKSTYKHSYSSLSHCGMEEDNDWDDKEGKIYEGLEVFDLAAIQIPADINQSLSHNALPSNYPQGNRTGSALHEIFENIDFTNYKVNIRNIILKAFENQGITLRDEFVDPTITMLENVLNAKLPVINGNKKVENESLFLSTISSGNLKKEVEFNFNFNNEKLKNYFNGFIDLVFKNGEHYSILDWKSDNLNEEFTSYSDNKMLKKHVDEAYSIQRVLYAYCLIKWLKSFYTNESESDIFNNHFGGIYYIFLRGCASGVGNGVYAQTWNSWNELNEAFQNIMKSKIWGVVINGQ